MEKYYLFYLSALVAEVIGTVSGFGSSILFVPLASLFFDFQTVLGITAVFHVFSNISKIILFQKGIDRNIAIKLGVPAVVFVIIGAYLSKIVPVDILEILMSIVLLGLSVLLMIFSRRTIEQSERNLVIGGVLSGFLAGLVGTGGSVRGLTLAAFALPKDIFVATSALIDLGVDSSRAVVYYFNGYLSLEFLYMVPFLIGVSILGSWIGKVLLARMSQQVFRYVVLSVIVLTSVAQLAKYL